MTAAHRLRSGGQIDRTEPLDFTFDGRPMTGFAGDTLASALLANGQFFVARSLKYHRPRGILSAGLEEPSALVAVDSGTGVVPNLKATEVVLTESMRAGSQNSWPRLEYDAGALLQIGACAMKAGFYYKTFKWPPGAWYKHYSKLIRRLAGHGVVDPMPDPAMYDRRNRFCDVLVIGSGAAGLSAAQTAADAGATVVLMEQDRLIGGSLLFSSDRIEGQPAQDWANDLADTLEGLPNVTVMPRTLAFGQYDHGLVKAVETCASDEVCREISWSIYGRRIVLATGATERPAVFPGNDRPGVMIASAVRAYIRRFSVVPGKRAVLAIADRDEREDTAKLLHAAGVSVVALDETDQILGTRGRRHLSSVSVRSEGGKPCRLNCDLLCVSEGWVPNAHLFAHLGGKLTFSKNANALIPEKRAETMLVAGAARGALSTSDCLSDGKIVAQVALAELGGDGPMPAILSPVTTQSKCDFSHGRGKGVAFVDLQNDVTAGDLALAAREGYRDIELAKRYTTLGMGTDQGKTSWTNGIISLAAATKTDPEILGHTTFRPPYSPVSLGALVGTGTGRAMSPVRRTPFHAAFKRMGCVFQTSGDWLYPRYFPRAAETMTEAVVREVRAVRTGLGCVDMSTLGKVDLQGPDARTFLERLYCNNLDKLKQGRLTYGLMLREDGIVFDDGTVAQLTPDHFLITMTTANTASVWRHMQKLLQVDWPELDVSMTLVSDHWASLAVAGPHARDLLKALAPDFWVDRAGFPFASVREGMLGGTLPTRIFSVSFSGELSYEINVPAGFADTLMKRVAEQGTQWGLTAYGLEALDIMRIEKGHIAVGTEIDGRRTPDDLGMGSLVSTRKDFIGRALLERPALVRDDRAQLVGLRPIDRETPIPTAAHLANAPPVGTKAPVLLGYLTASVHSPTLDMPIALAFLENGRARVGEPIWALAPIAGEQVQVEVCPPCFYDRKGERPRG
ncbi:MAG: FAD-binding protein [Rhodobacteraceae bacterium]|nr:FAD-binding protein [Paracoccaceae bacterium]